MKGGVFLSTLVLLGAIGTVVGGREAVRAGEMSAASDYRVLAPIPAWQSDGVSGCDIGFTRYARVFDSGRRT